MPKEETKQTLSMPPLHIAPSPHFGTSGRSTGSMMYDVAIALIPAVCMSVYVFGPIGVRIILISVATCLATEMLFQTIRGKEARLLDGSALVTGLILALSLPWTVPWWIPVIAGASAIGLGKMVFGGLGDNLFNPAMVGRAFVMICFTTQMTTWVMDGTTDPPHANAPLPAAVAAETVTPATQNVYAVKPTSPPAHEKAPATQAALAATSEPDAKTGATPLAAKTGYALQHMMIGTTNGCLGETSGLLLLIGGIYLCIRRTAAWQIPAGVLIGAMIVAVIQWACDRSVILTPGHHLFGGALMFGAFFIATDPVSSPVSARGRWVFALGLGALTMTIRLFAGYPEGMMFAVLIMNSIAPIINRWTIPVPVGGRPKVAKA